MSRTLVALVLPSVLFACRGPQDEVFDYVYPVLAVSESTVQFGTSGWGSVTERTFYVSNDGGTSSADGMTMAVSTITLLDTAPENYSFTYDVRETECTGAPAADTATDTSAAAAKALDIDTSPEPIDTGDTNPNDTGTPPDDTGSVPSDVLFLLDPGCRIPIHVTFAPTTAIGDVWGAMELVTESQEIAEDATDEQFLAAYHKDPVRLRKLVYLHGEAEHAAATLVVRPRTYDFGYVNTEDTDDHVAFIELENVGDGDLNLLGVELGEGCDEAYSFVVEPTLGVVEPGASTLAEVRFQPTDDQPAYCQLVVHSDDPAETSDGVDVTLTGNSGSDPENLPPTVFIRSPTNGYKYQGISPLELELNIFDVNQPATSLGCKVKSAVLQEGASIATCTATDESGHFWVEIDPGDLDSGTDTLQVVVTDGSGITATAAVSVVITTDYPADDDDGDGYGASDENPDCDETSRETYPGAAEIYDGLDNDCDNIIDEGTEGYDDDGDSYSEEQGDCNDYNDSAYLGAPERGDGVDNDCDGIVDEGTSLSDDDNDGYAEVNNDCDDGDDTRHPGATEVCDDHIDNDCNGLVDSADACLDSNSNPVIVGGEAGVAADQYACESGQTITLSAIVYDADGQVPTYSWADDDATMENYDNASASTVHWTCPTLDSNSGGKAYLVSVQILDPDANDDYAYTKIAVYPEGFGLYDPFQVLVLGEKKGCATVSAVPALSIVGLALAAAGIRRRRA